MQQFQLGAEGVAIDAENLCSFELIAFSFSEHHLDKRPFETRHDDAVNIVHGLNINGAQNAVQLLLDEIFKRYVVKLQAERTARLAYGL